MCIYVLYVYVVDPSSSIALSLVLGGSSAFSVPWKERDEEELSDLSGFLFIRAYIPILYDAFNYRLRYRFSITRNNIYK